MNKVFGILLAGFVLAIGSASSPSIAGNWNQADKNPWKAQDIKQSLSIFDFWLRFNYQQKKNICKRDPNHLSCTSEDETAVLNQLPDANKARVYREGWVLPFKRNPNYETLLYYLYKYTESHKAFDPLTYQWLRYEIKPSNKKMQLKSNVKPFALAGKQMQTKGILSYLFFENGEITVDEISPRNRFGDFISNKTQFRSNSMGKSIASYVLGHAICEGIIDSEDAIIDDWPLLEGTLYNDQKLIDLLNMTAGDQRFVYDSHYLLNGRANRSVNTEIETKSIRQNMVNFRNKQPSSNRIYNYNVMNTYLILNYVLFKSGKDFEPLLQRIFAERVGIENSVYFSKNRHSSPAAGNISNMFFASRYDYLRIAIKILHDWQSDNCVGQYLKRIYEKRVPKNLKNLNDEPQFNRSKSYGGQFHFEYPGINKRKVIGMGGYGGQAILIDTDSSRIVVVNSLHYNHNKFKYDVKGLLINPIKNGIGQKTTGIQGFFTKKSPVFEDNKKPTKYDRTVAGMKVRFKCLADYAAANDIADLPANQEIESLTANLEGNDYYRSHRQIVKAGISKEATDTNKKALVRLVNFEGTNEEYCAKPVL